MPIVVVSRLGHQRCLLELGRALFSSSSVAAASAAAAVKRKPHYEHVRTAPSRESNAMDGGGQRGGRGAGGGRGRGGHAQGGGVRGGHQQQYGFTEPSGSSQRFRGGQPQQNQRGGRGGGKQKQKPPAPVIPTVDALFDEAHLQQTFNPNGLQFLPAWTSNPKEILGLYAKDIGLKIRYDSTRIMFTGEPHYRASLKIEDVVYEGDALTKREAERLASIGAVLDLAVQGKLDPFLPAKATVDPIQFEDGTIVDYEFAKSFMEYYCRRFGFETPEIAYEVQKARGGNPPWDAVLSVGGRRIGIGTGANKKVAMQLAFLDVTQYIHSCDDELWKGFLADRRTGKDLGLAPRVMMGLTDRLGDNVANLNRFLNASQLFRNRPGPVAPVQVPTTQTQKLYQPPRFRLSDDFLERKSATLKEGREAYAVNPSLEKMRAQRESLPVYTQAEALLKMVDENEVTICMAATGSGKTTQIPQIILDHFIAEGKGSKCNVLCTQPRRLAAISVAERVAKERGETAGQSVGYQVRFEAKHPEPHGSITFCTTGVFLRRMQTALEGSGSRGSQSMDEVTHLIVDEAHERDVDTDLTLMVLKRLLDDRRARGIPLKVVLMSATIDPTLFQRYFSTPSGELAPLISIPGRSFPVERHFLNEFFGEMKENIGASSWIFREDSVTKYLNREIGVGMWGQPPPLLRAGSSFNSVQSIGSAANSPRNSPKLGPEDQPRRDDDLEIPYPLVALTIAHVLNKSTDGHVLVFMPGWEEIQAVNRILQDSSKPLLGINFNDKSKYQTLILHSSVPVAEQQQVFEPPPEGVRRIILSTNVAETSVTIPDVVYVVDSARVKELRYEPDRHMSSLVQAWVGKSNLNQRAGRAGRHRPGEYYGVLSSDRAEALQSYQTVEMLRVDLSNVVMHVKALNFPGMEVEDVLANTIEPPEPERIETAMEHLRMSGALDNQKDLTPLGRILLQLPIETQIGRLVLFGAFFRCFDRALLLAAILTNRDPFMTPLLQKRDAQARKDSWAIPEFRSDPLTVLRAYEAWWTLQSRGDYNSANQFCFENYLSKPTLLMINKIKTHLLASCWSTGIVDIALGRQAAPQRAGGAGPAGTNFMPHELNENGDSMSLLAALIATAAQPKFAVRTGERTFRTQREKATFIHPSSVNHLTREGSKDDARESAYNHDLYAFAEKRQNLTTGQDKPQMYLMSTTKLEPLLYVLFGAYEVRPVENGLECDQWVPVGGYFPLLQEVGRLKVNLESCLLRVYEGLANARSQVRGRRPAVPEREDEWEAEDDGTGRGGPLSQTELNEVTTLGRELGSLLDRYSADRSIVSASRRGSRPATPDGGGGRLDLPRMRSGYNTPKRMDSRPGTPSRLRF